MLLGRYRLGCELGRGAYGVVNAARDFRDGRRSIAIKSLDLSVLPRSETAWTADAIEQEVALMRRLDHPNVVRVYDLVRASGSDRLFIIMELCRGPDLQLVLAKRGATELCEAAAVLRQCVDALLHLHSRGIVHRDVKPSNICFASPISDLRRSSLREEQVKLVDFGLARRLPFPCISPPAPSRRRGEGSPSRRDGSPAAASRRSGGGGGEKRGESGGGKRGEPEKKGGSEDGGGGGGSGGLGGHVAFSAEALDGGGVRGTQERHDLSAHGNTLYLSPEVRAAILTRTSSMSLSAAEAARLDVFSLGLVLRFMLLGKAPAPVLAAEEARGRVEQVGGGGGCCWAAAAGPAPATREPEELPAAVAELVRRMTADAAAERIGLSEIAAHAFLRGEGDCSAHSALSCASST